MKPKYLLGGSLIVAAAAFLIVTSMTANAQYFLTVTQLRDKGQSIVDQSVRISGAVIYESTLYEVRNNRAAIWNSTWSIPKIRSASRRRCASFTGAQAGPVAAARAGHC